AGSPSRAPGSFTQSYPKTPPAAYCGRRDRRTERETRDDLEVEERAQASPRVVLVVIEVVAGRRRDHASGRAGSRATDHLVRRHRVAAARADIGGEVELRGHGEAQAHTELAEVLRGRVRARDIRLLHTEAGEHVRREAIARTDLVDQ